MGYMKFIRVGEAGETAQKPGAPSGLAEDLGFILFLVATLHL